MRIHVRRYGHLVEWVVFGLAFVGAVGWLFIVLSESEEETEHEEVLSLVPALTAPMAHTGTDARTRRASRAKPEVVPRRTFSSRAPAVA